MVARDGRVVLGSLVICMLARVITSQQQYTGNSVLDCRSNHVNSSNLLYLVNGQRASCQTYLIFKSRHPYNSVPTISILMSVDPSELARANNVTALAVFDTNKEVIVPVNCFSSGQYYQANTTYEIPPQKSTYFVVANDTYQGLSTCDALRFTNPYDEFGLLGGMELQVPLRCACPTANQTGQGTKYLLTYSVSWEDHVPDIGDRFHVTTESLLDANELLPGDCIFPFTTILVPLKDAPTSSQTIIQNKTRTDSPPDATARKGSQPNKVYLGAGIAVGSSLAVCVSLICIGILQRRKSRSESCCGNGDKGESKAILPMNVLSEIASYDQSLRIFKYEELKGATENFSSKNLIKGSVYFGEIKGRSVAIKRTSTDVSREVNMLNKINHFNLTELYGICIRKDRTYLVYEYLENGSLKEWLSNENSRESRSWMRRIQIALDVASGLHYLHNFMESVYVHKAIKSSSILLTSNLRAKITSFNLGKTAARGTRNVPLTNKIVGTRGYMAPEYVKLGAVTTKLDVYAFGVVMLELLTGKDAVMMQEGKEVSLKEEVITLMEGDAADAAVGDLIDSRLKGNAAMLFAVPAIQLSIACVKTDPVSRPCMGEVVSSLLKLQADMEKSQIYVG
uniref:Uncharacterized protein n=1 Tax=Kalanchoe fedtschenkoi TaxID=63787 RepID=A0A7N0ZVQ5_KALFE